MDTIDKFKINHKYYITLDTPYDENKINLRIIIHDLIPKLGTDAVDYVIFFTLPSSKHIINSCGLNEIHMPLPYIKNVQTLHDILKGVFIDDMIYLINQFI
jgi:hypothetical protein